MDQVTELERIVTEAPARVAAAANLDELESIEGDLTGRRSRLQQIRRGVGGLEADQKPVVGRAVHEASSELEAMISSRRDTLDRMAEDALLELDRADISLDSFRVSEGSIHLIESTIREVCEIFIALGYEVAMGPEAETAWHNFDALNTPVTHPSRFEEDTIYLDWGDPDDEILLRTQTSPMQVRLMMSKPPPIYTVVPGRTYRADTPDATHSPVFNQIEGLVVDEDITMGDLVGTLGHFAREYFGRQHKVRLIPHFFPFTEPSAEMAVTCFACDGGEPGCRVCGSTGWVELMGCGMVDPAVFEAVGYDPSVVTGFAFGMGPERLAMVRHGIDSISHLYENDLRTLRQFR